MRKIILMILLAVVSNSAMAEWRITSENGFADLYVNLDTYLKAGNTVRVWELQDYKKAITLASSGDKYLSTTALNEYDCKEKKFRALIFNSHSDHMGEGKLVFSQNTSGGNWYPVAPAGTISGDIFIVLCGKE